MTILDERATLFLRMAELLTDITIDPKDRGQQDKLIVGWRSIAQAVWRHVEQIKADGEY